MKLVRKPQATMAEIAANLRQLADELDAGAFKACEYSDDVESVPVGLHKACLVRATTGKRCVFLELQSAKHRPMELGIMIDLCDQAWYANGGAGILDRLVEGRGES